MDIRGIAGLATDMKTSYLQTEVSAKVLKMTEDTVVQESADLLRMMNASVTGVGLNIDVYI